MSTKKALHSRSESKCELCGASDDLNVYNIPPTSADTVDDSILACATCTGQIEDPETIDVHHWRCLNDSMWSQVPAVQVVAWRMLKLLGSKGEAWAQDALDMMYLDDETKAWAQALEPVASDEDAVVHLDSKGEVLATGDTVALIKDLDVKGTSFVAKRGTAVRGIAFVDSNPEHIEGRVNGTRIVILTKFVKKAL